MALALTTFDGHTINGASSYAVELRAANPISHDASIAVTTRRNTAPSLDSMAVNPLDYLLVITPADAATAYATWKTNVQQWFSPSNSDVTRVLAGTVDDGTAVTMDVVVVSRRLIRDSGVIGKGALRYDVVVRALWPFWEATATTTNSGAAITNAGNAVALPSLSLTSAVHKTRRVTTVVGAGAGGGLVSYPVLFTLNDTVATGGGTFVFIEGVSVPTFVVNSGGAASKVWALVDTASDGSTLTHIDIVYGTGLSNPLGNTLDMGGMDTAGATNTSWKWSDLRINRWPSRPGTWRPVAAGNHHSSAQISYGISAEGSGTTVFAIGTPGQYAGDADGMVLVVGTRTATGTGQLSAITPTLAYTVDGYTVSSINAMDQASVTSSAASAQATITSSSVANPTVITTSAAHGLTTGDTVNIAGHTGSTPALSGTYTATVLTTTTFTIPVNVTVGGTGGTATRMAGWSRITTGTAHNLSAGDTVTITGHSGSTPAISGDYIVASSPAPTLHTFAIPVNVTVAGTGGLATRAGTTSKPNPSIVHVSANHGLAVGDQVTLAGTTGYTPDINGNTYTVLASPAPTTRTFAISDTVTVIGGGVTPTATKVHTARAYVRYRTPGATSWTDAWTSNVSGAGPSSIDVPAAVEIIIGVENFGAAADPCTLTITSGTTLTLALDSSYTPTVVVAAATNCDFYNGTYQIGNGPTLTLDHLLVPDGTMTIDAKARNIIPAGNGPIYAGSANPPIQFSLSPYWQEVSPGAQTISNGTGGTVAVSIHSCWEPA